MSRLVSRLRSWNIPRGHGVCTLISTFNNRKARSVIKHESTYNFLSSLSSPSVLKGEEISTLNSKVDLIIQSVNGMGLNENEIKTLTEIQPELLKISTKHWNNVVKTLVESGFPKDNVLAILEKWPQVLLLNKDGLAKNLVVWTGLGFGDELLFSLLTTHPYFLQVNEFSKRIRQYQVHFESKKRVGKLLLLAPNTLEENWKIICDKLNYLDDLCTEKSDVVSSGVLAHSLFHIIVRHEFLIRAGIYKRPQKDFHKRLSKNPKLERIVNTKDDEFVNSVAKLSMFEYSIFMELFEEECSDKNSFDSDSDEEDSYKLNYNKHCRNNNK